MNSHRGPRTQKENSPYRPGRGTRSCYSGCRAPGIRCYGATAAETRPLSTRGKTQEPLRLRNINGQWPGKTSTADYSQDNFATQTCKNSPIFPRQHHYQSSSPPSSKNMCHISGLDLNRHFLEAVCRSESGNAVTSRPVSVQILLFPARAIGTGTHTRPVNHPRPRQKRGSVHPRARRSDIASTSLDPRCNWTSKLQQHHRHHLPASTSNASILLDPRESEHHLCRALPLSDTENVFGPSHN